MLALRGSNVFYFGGIVIHGWPLFKFAAFWAVLFLVVGFFGGKFMSRGYTQFTLTQGIGFWPAAAVMSVAFGAIHLGNQGEDRIGALAAAAIGLFFCLTLRRTGDLWFAVGFHAAWDWGETYLYSVPNSGVVAPGHLLSSSFHGSKWLTGGSVGPEGSLLVFVVIALLWIAFHLDFSRGEISDRQTPADGVSSISFAKSGHHDACDQDCHPDRSRSASDGAAEDLAFASPSEPDTSSQRLPERSFGGTEIA